MDSHAGGQTRRQRMSVRDLKLDFSERSAKMTSALRFKYHPGTGEVPKNSYSYDVKYCRWFALRTSA